MTKNLSQQFLRVLYVAFFVWFTLVLLFSNRQDWDFFYTTIEVDRRAWLSGELPLWSYQFCGGSTRIADPQSYAFSPLFVFPLIFGSLMGPKIMILFCAALGFWFLRKLLVEFLDWLSLDDKNSNENWGSVLALLCIFQNWFIWTFKVGHVVCSENYLLFGLIYFIVQTFKRPLSSKENVLAVGLVWAILGGGLFPTFVYLLIPLAGTALLALPVFLLSKYASKLKLAVIRSAPFLLAGLILVSFRFYHIWSYHRLHPRVVVENMFEQNTPSELLFYLLFPVFDAKFPWNFKEVRSYGIWEYTFFSIFPWLIGAHLVALLVKLKTGIRKVPFPIICLMGFHMALTFLLALGQFSDSSPFSILKVHLFSNSIRVPARFLLGLTYALPFVVAYMTSHIASKKYLHFSLLFSCMLGVANFAPIDQYLWKAPFIRLWKLEPEKSYKMSKLDGGDASNEDMYPTVISGASILDCYQPIIRSKDVPFEKLKQIPMIAGLNESVECLQGSYYTQNKIVLNSACSPGVCLNFLDINPIEKDKFKLDEATKKYCRVQ